MNSNIEMMKIIFFNIIRKSKKIENKIKDMNFKLKVMNRLVIQNLKNFGRQIQEKGLQSIESFDVFKFGSEEITKAVFDIK